MIKDSKVLSVLLTFVFVGSASCASSSTARTFEENQIRRVAESAAEDDQRARAVCNSIEKTNKDLEGVVAQLSYLQNLAAQEATECEKRMMKLKVSNLAPFSSYRSQPSH